MTRTLAAVVVVLSLLCLVSYVPAYPKPSPFLISWQFEFEHAVPRRVVLTPPGSEVPQAYWYVTYMITNKSEQEQMFLPVFEMLDGAGQPIRSDRDVPPAIFDAVKAMEKNELLEPAHEITGRVLVGEDQARDGVAIWAEPETMPETLTIFAAGLSGESELYRFEDGEYIKVTSGEELKTLDRSKLLLLRKTMQMQYRIVGDLNQARLDAIGDQWIMR